MGEKVKMTFFLSSDLYWQMGLKHLLNRGFPTTLSSAIKRGKYKTYRSPMFNYCLAASKGIMDIYELSSCSFSAPSKKKIFSINNTSTLEGSYAVNTCWMLAVSTVASLMKSKQGSSCWGERQFCLIPSCFNTSLESLEIGEWLTFFYLKAFQIIWSIIIHYGIFFYKPFRQKNVISHKSFLPSPFFFFFLFFFLRKS